MNNIVLIGMPGCGKSSAGVLLAKTLEKDFVDTDLLIQKCEGMSLQEIIDTHSRIVFFGGAGVSTESGIPDFRSQDGLYNMQYRYPPETIISHVTAPEIIKRLSNIKTRGVTLAPGQTIEDLYNERVPLYEKEADIIVETEGLDLEETVTKIAKVCP